MKSRNMIQKLKRHLAGALVLSMLLQDMSAFASSSNTGDLLNQNRASRSEADSVPMVFDSSGGSAPQVDAEFGTMQGGQAAVDGLPNAVTMNKKALATGPISINTLVSNIAYLDGVALHVDLPYIVKDAQGNVLSFYGERDDIEQNGYTLLGGLEISFDAAGAFQAYDPKDSEKYREQYKPADLNLSSYLLEPTEDEKEAVQQDNQMTEDNGVEDQQGGGGRKMKIPAPRKMIQKIV